MSLITFIVVVVIIGVALWLINTYIPMQANVKKFLNIAVVVLLILWLLYAIGILPAGDIRVPRVR